MVVLTTAHAGGQRNEQPHWVLFAVIHTLATAWHAIWLHTTCAGQPERWRSWSPERHSSKFGCIFTWTTRQSATVATRTVPPAADTCTHWTEQLLDSSWAQDMCSAAPGFTLLSTKRVLRS